MNAELYERLKSAGMDDVIDMLGKFHNKVVELENENAELKGFTQRQSKKLDGFLYLAQLLEEYPDQSNKIKSMFSAHWAGAYNNLDSFEQFRQTFLDDEVGWWYD